MNLRRSAIVGYDGGPEIECGFHLLAIPLFSLSHSGQTYADLGMKMIDALCPDWRMKLIGSSTDGAGNMTGHNAGSLPFFEMNRCAPIHSTASGVLPISLTLW
jgi:hypothetical protein